MSDLEFSGARWLADAVLVVHVLFVLFVVGGQVLILLGWWRDWRCTRQRAFRLLHLIAIGVVVLLTWAGLVCPLTELEDVLRRAHGQPDYRQLGFIAYWLQALLYWRAPSWVFGAIYTLFAGVVVFSFWRYPPEPRRHNRYNGGHERDAQQNPPD